MTEQLFIRSKLNPILRPDPASPWESCKLYNPGAIYEDGAFHLFYRALGGAWVSKIGHSISTDGEKFELDKFPDMAPVLNIEKNGIEDPRIVKIKERYYMTYNAFDGDISRLCLTVSDDLNEWERRGEMIPEWDGLRAENFTVSWDSAQMNADHKNRWVKSGAIFPETFGDSFHMLFGDRHLWLASSTDGAVWHPVWEPFLRPRTGYFDSVHVEAGPPPIRTEKGWLALYHGVNDKRIYSIGFLLLDLKDPRKILFRTDEPIFWPQEDYELSGIVDVLPGGLDAMEMMTDKELANHLGRAQSSGIMPKVVFCSGAVVVDGKLRIYYGAGDSVICTASADLKDLLDICR